MKEAEAVVDEMAHNLRVGVIRGFAIFLVKVMKSLFQRIYVNEEAIQKVR
jgi:glycerone phosphate O-acyltransferase